TTNGRLRQRRVALARCESLAGRHGEAVAHSDEALELARPEDLRPRYVTSAEETYRMAAVAAEHAGKPGATSDGRWTRRPAAARSRSGAARPAPPGRCIAPRCAPPVIAAPSPRRAAARCRPAAARRGPAAGATARNSARRSLRSQRS